jgi:hypothetical protein
LRFSIFLERFFIINVRLAVFSVFSTDLAYPIPITGKDDPHPSSTNAKEREKIEAADQDIPDPPALPEHLVVHERRASRVNVEV